MKLKKFGAVMVAILALGAVMAGSAFATATTEAKQWYTGTTEAGVTTLPVGTAQKVTASIGEHPTIGTKFTLKSTVGTNNVPLDLTATGVECVECVIENKTVGSSVVATGKGKVKFTGVTAMEPEECKVAGGSVTTNALAVEAHYMEGTKALEKFKPASGGLAFATITIEGCSLAGSYIVKTEKGLFSEAKNLTGVFKTEQGNVFSPAINSAAGGNLFLESTTHPAELTGTGVFKAPGAVTENEKHEKVQDYLFFGIK